MVRKISAAEFAAFLKTRLAAKDGYIMGAVGQDPKKLSDWWFSGQYSGKQLTKALYWKKNCARVWDCNGLAEGYYKEKTGTDINTQARYNYSGWCDPRGSGMIPAAYRMPGAAVFKKSTYIHHVGFLVEPVDRGNPGGDWYVIEAKGVMYGVIRTKLLSGGWNYWGLMTKHFDYGTAGEAPKDFTLGGRLLKKGAEGADVKQLQLILTDLGYDLPKYGADGDYGSETVSAVKKLQAALGVLVDGEYGDDTHEALMAHLERDEQDEEIEDTAAQVRIRVTAAQSAFVRSGPGTGYGIITVVRSGVEYDSAALAENGWRSVNVNGKTGWISGKMCEEI